MHHKFVIIDDSTVITGSFNWTYYGYAHHSENVIILNNEKVVENFVDEF